MHGQSEQLKSKSGGKVTLLENIMRVNQKVPETDAVKRCF